LTPDLVVEEASHPGHPLYGEFDWNDASAAHQHRLAVARALIRSVEYISEDSTGSVVTAVAYIHEPNKSAQGYIPVSEVQRNKEQARAAIMAELAAVESYLRRAQRIASALHMWGDDLEKLLDDVVDLRERVRKPQPKAKQPPPNNKRKGSGRRGSSAPPPAA
jgi:hypothetical protein